MGDGQEGRRREAPEGGTSVTRTSWGRKHWHWQTYTVSYHSHQSNPIPADLLPIPLWREIMQRTITRPFPIYIDPNSIRH